MTSSDIQNTQLRQVSFLAPSAMTFENAEEVYASFKGALHDQRICFMLDLSKVENITTAGLQIIISVDKYLSGTGGQLQITGLSPSVAAAFKDMGLEKVLQQFQMRQKVAA